MHSLAISNQNTIYQLQCFIVTVQEARLQKPCVKQTLKTQHHAEYDDYSIVSKMGLCLNINSQQKECANWSTIQKELSPKWKQLNGSKIQAQHYPKKQGATASSLITRLNNRLVNTICFIIYLFIYPNIIYTNISWTDFKQPMMNSNGTVPNYLTTFHNGTPTHSYTPIQVPNQSVKSNISRVGDGMPNLDVFHIPNTNVTTHPSGQVSNSHNLTHNINANPSAYLAVQNMNTKDSKMENIKYNRQIHLVPQTNQHMQKQSFGDNRHRQQSYSHRPIPASTSPHSTPLILPYSPQNQNINQLKVANSQFANNFNNSVPKNEYTLSLSSPTLAKPNQYKNYHSTNHMQIYSPRYSQNNQGYNYQSKMGSDAQGKFNNFVATDGIIQANNNNNALRTNVIKKTDSYVNSHQNSTANIHKNDDNPDNSNGFPNLIAEILTGQLSQALGTKNQTYEAHFNQRQNNLTKSNPASSPTIKNLLYLDEAQNQTKNEIQSSKDGQANPLTLIYNILSSQKSHQYAQHNNRSAVDSMDHITNIDKHLGLNLVNMINSANQKTNYNNISQKQVQNAKEYNLTQGCKPPENLNFGTQKQKTRLSQCPQFIKSRVNKQKTGSIQSQVSGARTISRNKSKYRQSTQRSPLIKKQNNINFGTKLRQTQYTQDIETNNLNSVIQSSAKIRLQTKPTIKKIDTSSQQQNIVDTDYNFTKKVGKHRKKKSNNTTKTDMKAQTITNTQKGDSSSIDKGGREIPKLNNDKHRIDYRSKQGTDKIKKSLRVNTGIQVDMKVSREVSIGSGQVNTNNSISQNTVNQKSVNTQPYLLQQKQVGPNSNVSDSESTNKNKSIPIRMIINSNTLNKEEQGNLGNVQLSKIQPKYNKIAGCGISPNRISSNIQQMGSSQYNLRVLDFIQLPVFKAYQQLDQSQQPSNRLLETAINLEYTGQDKQPEIRMVQSTLQSIYNFSLSKYQQNIKNSSDANNADKKQRIGALSSSQKTNTNKQINLTNHGSTNHTNASNIPSRDRIQENIGKMRKKYSNNTLNANALDYNNNNNNEKNNNEKNNENILDSKNYMSVQSQHPHNKFHASKYNSINSQDIKFRQEESINISVIPQSICQSKDSHYIYHTRNTLINETTNNRIHNSNYTSSHDVIGDDSKQQYNESIDQKSEEEQDYDQASFQASQAMEKSVSVNYKVKGKSQQNQSGTIKNNTSQADNTQKADINLNNGNLRNSNSLNIDAITNKKQGAYEFHKSSANSITTSNILNHSENPSLNKRQIYPVLNKNKIAQTSYMQKNKAQDLELMSKFYTQCDPESPIYTKVKILKGNKNSNSHLNAINNKSELQNVHFCFQTMAHIISTFSQLKQLIEFEFKQHRNYIEKWSKQLCNTYKNLLNQKQQIINAVKLENTQLLERIRQLESEEMDSSAIMGISKAKYNVQTKNSYYTPTQLQVQVKGKSEGTNGQKQLAGLQKELEGKQIQMMKFLDKWKEDKLWIKLDKLENLLGRQVERAGRTGNINNMNDGDISSNKATK